MAVFDLNKKKEGIWFDFPTGGRVKLKTITVDDALRIEKETTEYKPFVYETPGKPAQVLTQEIVDKDKRARLYNDCLILEWEGFLDKNETEIPCNTETKTTLMRMDDPIFRDFVNEKIKIMEEAEKAASEEARKNLLSGSNG